ncbi:hypothetical protein [Dysgonomonas sp. BGC7]|uniref:hypothetical protein n=1 Tax=Dysgonomonas sp. BGC7 TaxID=1658008 RepID=UPI000682BCC3|nr:hypothetical protein [Dysgonomonas sp. BGC7]MBD8389034.1 hypothetical protein [Dysgonomonas sp. BGC7]
MLAKVTNDTITLNIPSSYHSIDKYKTWQENDTLFITVKSIHSPNKLLYPIRIFLSSEINYIKLQNDKIFNVDSIPYVPY